MYNDDEYAIFRLKAGIPPPYAVVDATAFHQLLADPPLPSRYVWVLLDFPNP